MDKGLIANATIVIHAPVAEVWNALVNPEIIKQYMFGTNVVSDWKEGSTIAWKGEWQGKAYQDKGKILRIEKERLVQYSHFSPLTGKPDAPENYHTVTIELSGDKTKTELLLTQDNNANEEDRKHSEENWKLMLEGLKQLLEK